MKEELEKLRFDYINRRYWLELQDTYRYIIVDESGDTFIQDFDNESVYLFDHDHEKLKQLIQILS